MPSKSIEESMPELDILFEKIQNKINDLQRDVETVKNLNTFEEKIEYLKNKGLKQ